jgi:hypothetical protein
LESDAHAEAPARRDIGSAFNHHGGLIQAETVAQHVISAQQIDAPDGLIEVA